MIQIISSWLWLFFFLSLILWFSANISRIVSFYQDNFSCFSSSFTFIYFLIESQVKIYENFNAHNFERYFIDNKVIDEGSTWICHVSSSSICVVKSAFTKNLCEWFVRVHTAHFHHIVVWIERISNIFGYTRLENFAQWFHKSIQLFTIILCVPTNTFNVCIEEGSEEVAQVRTHCSSIKNYVVPRMQSRTFKFKTSAQYRPLQNSYVAHDIFAQKLMRLRVNRVPIILNFIARYVERHVIDAQIC